MARPSPAPVRGPVGCLPATIRARAASRPLRTWAGLSHSAHEPSHMYILHATSHATRRLGSYTHTASRRKAEIGNCARKTRRSPGSASGLGCDGSPTPDPTFPRKSPTRCLDGSGRLGPAIQNSPAGLTIPRETARETWHMCSCEIDDEHPLPNGLVNQASQASKVQSPNIHRGRGRPASRRRSCLEHRQ